MKVIIVFRKKASKGNKNLFILIRRVINQSSSFDAMWSDVATAPVLVNIEWAIPLYSHGLRLKKSNDQYVINQ